MLKQKTVYFREEDLPLWEAVENKAEWLHDRLNGGETRVSKVNDRLYVVNGKDPLKYYDATTEKTFEPKKAILRGFSKEIDGTEVNLPTLDQEILAKGLTPKKLLTVKFCKVHGTPLTPQGKCLQKGCKYA